LSKIPSLSVGRQSLAIRKEWATPAGLEPATC
jgi:hypothetical protein